MSTFSLEQLTEGIRQRHLGSQNRELTEKWARTGLLRGLDGVKRENMARLMENQASQVLKEQSSLSNGSGGLANSGDMRGFTNIAFPIVRRVFGGLIANDLVSIQPMSLPSGLLFYLDYTRPGLTDVSDDNDGAHGIASGSSIYGDPVGKATQPGASATGGLYDLAGNGYSRVYDNVNGITISNSGSFIDNSWSDEHADTRDGAKTEVMRPRTVGISGSDGKAIQFDPQLTKQIEDRTHAYRIAFVSLASGFDGADTSLVKEWSLQGGTVGEIVDEVQGGASKNVKRLNQLVTWDGTNYEAAPLGVPGETANLHLLTVISSSFNHAALAADNVAQKKAPTRVSFPVADKLESGNGSSVVVPSFESNFGSTPSPAIPEIDIKVEALPVVAQSRKLRARWSPELAQDLNAYHSLDAEVELTQILSEQIALEIDREVLNDLLTQAGAANYYWSRAPGRFLNKETGAVTSVSASFTGTVREWYETLVETIIDVANQIHRKTLRGSANFIVVGPDVATILEASVLYKPSYSLDGDGQVSGMVIGAEKVGTLSNRFTVYKDPYFPRNKVLVGYKGGSYLETGYVYAPYVPLIVTPTIFAPEDFTPRKGVMTRYGKKMVRADFYGTVTCADMSVI